MLEQLDHIQDICVVAQENIIKSKQIMARYHDPKVRHRSFQPNDLVLRCAEVSALEMARGKFAPTWEGPYLMKEVFPDGS